MKYVAKLICILLIILTATPCIAGEKLVLSGIKSPRSKIVYEILREAYSSLGVEIEFKALPLLRSTHSAHSGAVDGELFKISGIEEQYPNLIKVPVPIDHVNLMVLTRKDSKINATWKSLRPLRVGYFRGIVFIENKISTENLRSAKSLETNEQLVKMINLKRLDAGLIARIAGIVTLKKTHSDNVRMLQQPIATTNLYHYLNIKHSALVPKLTKVLKRMSEKGRFKEIRKKILKQEFSKYD
ncbi:substrate-binding periplasmic protein [Maridesulfovibrio salexigens]|uniref:Uncharacterized protein n=1 Tax=Maridesulfovibrio salexigens (strain ATCC 14822 / DSM 2638 / NCIMB 8403 / VKM B-1763) TaxID=526222 RepID=C6BZS0_MARSD|nr:transporter substrate-binding domain-containing protein [Maridesulfovibrio salexigens]ACS78977.1 conserved hypothetical protein [Maridesulfovibrio salexigens DSM 2638]